MPNVYDLHLRSTSLNLPRRLSGERPRISGSHSAAAPEPARAYEHGGSKTIVPEPPRHAQ
jgi:hypothetical protein